MCGVVGYAGPRKAIDIVYKGLKTLEYRGYDSAGVASLSHGRLHMQKTAGKLSQLEPLLQKLPIQSHICIGHTRWATHGAPTHTNAHPHEAPQIAIVHNGIIENHRELKASLIKEGAVFRSETDSEVIAHLLHALLHKNKSIETSFCQLFKILKGSFALGVLLENEPDKCFLGKSGSPLVIGLGEGENIFSSDPNAFAGITNKAVFLEDQQWAILSAEQVTVYDTEGQELAPTPKILQVNPASLEKQGHRHFMIKEIHEQPLIIAETINRLVDFKNMTLSQEPMGFANLDVNRIDNIHIIACGTAYLAGLTGKYFMEAILRKPVNIELASEFRYRTPYITSSSLVIAISQSGETADTLACVEYALKKDCQVLSLCNVEHAAIPRAAHASFLMQAGPEIGVASTKAFSSQILCLYLFTLCYAQKLKYISSDELSTLFEELRSLPVQLDQALSQAPQIESLALKYHRAKDFLYLGRGLNYPIALEGALKLKEVSYIHAEGYGAGELKHGPIALIDKHIPVVALAPDDLYHDKTLSNVAEVSCRGGRMIGIGSLDNANFQELCEDYIPTPQSSNPVFQAIINAIPIQLLAYYTAVHRGTDVDQPRNLAKSVTVE